MSATFKFRLIAWLWDGLTASVGGVANTLIALLGVDVTNAVSAHTIARFTPHQISMMLLSSFLVSWAMYYRQRKPPTFYVTSSGDVPMPKDGQ